MLTDVNMDDPHEDSNVGSNSRQTPQKGSAKPLPRTSQSQQTNQDGFGFPSTAPANHRALESSTSASASGSSDSITGPKPGDTRSPMTTPQKPIQLGGSAVSRSGPGVAATPTSGLSRRMSGKMSLGSLGSSNLDGSSFTAHRDSRPGVPDTPVLSPPTSTAGVTSPPFNGSISPPLMRTMPMQSPFAGVPANSPWAHLAATSGVPTPSLEGPGGPINSPFGQPSGASQFVDPGSRAGQGRSISPHLGAPFELLNLGGGGAPGTVVAGTSKSPPMGWPGYGGSGMTAQTPGLNTTNMADPFSSLPAPTSSSMRPQGGRETGAGLDSLAAKLAKRRGSKSGPSGLSQSTSVESGMNESTGKVPSQGAATGQSAGAVGTNGRSYGGPISGPGRSNAGAAPMKLNLPAGIAGRSGGASQPSSTSSTPGTSLSNPQAPANGKGNTTVPKALLPSQLLPMLGRPFGQVLILDLRPPSSYAQSHLPGALSLPVPSTLLKRPAFSIEKLAQMLSKGAASAITDFKTADEIVIIDQDSPIAAPGSLIVGLASKFGSAMTEAESQARQGHVHFVKGGMAACSDLEGVTFEQGQPESSEDETDAQAPGPSSPGSPTGQPGRMIGRLAQSAFSSASASGVGQRRANAPKSLTLPNTPSVKANAEPSGGEAMQVLQNESDAATSGNQRAGTMSPRSGPRPTPGRAQVTEKQKLQPANPFFDNIRQNLELAHGGILERIPLELPDEIKARANELPDFLRDMLQRPSPEVAEQLAKEFERVERDEQKRLQGIMDWHSRDTRLAENKTPMAPGNLKRLASTGYIRTTQKQSDMDQHDQSDYFPFSITAGVERGSKNRYKNIWPYDFSRVRLKEKCYDDGSDYINANFIQPQGTTKRYIATQGPLDATFRDFWTLVWEQQVHVIVMLTKQFEGGACKCGAYWTAGQYGPFRLEHVSTEGGEDTAEKDVSGFNFHVGGNTGPSSEAPNIKRTFLLSHSQCPDEKPRKVTQLQCVAWPDFDVPEDPRLLLGLVKEVDKAAVDLPEEKDQSRKAPVLVHCSAGVGRTGSFMVVDSILDGLRREHQRQHRRIRGSYSSARGRKGGAGEGGIEERRPSTASSHSAESALASYHSNSSLHRLASSNVLNLASPGKDSAVLDKSPELARMTSPLPMSTEKPSFGQSFSVDSKVDPTKIRTPEATDDEMSFIPLITGENQDDGEVNSISEMDRPVQSVLGGMRVQRMSLVQSLRQYAFVYRAIIYGFLDILDEEKEAEAEVVAMHEGRDLGSNPNADEESHVKRRASPTSLSGPNLHLHKRPSIKITRGPPKKVDGEETHRTSSGLSNETSLGDDPVSRSMDTD